MTAVSTASRCGNVILLGRTNVGKSTLLNRLLGTKLSITSRRPQTTVEGITGIVTSGTVQTVYLDTPGLGQDAGKVNRVSCGRIAEADLGLFVISAPGWRRADEWALSRVQQVRKELQTESLSLPLILVINKADLVKPPERILPLLAESSTRGDFCELIPVSAKYGLQTERLSTCIASMLPETSHRFPADYLSDRDDRFRVVELVREKLFRCLGQELPYRTRVKLEEFSRRNGRLQIRMVLQLARPGHKSIVIGRGGTMLRKIGMQARSDMEKIFAVPVHLHLWVQVEQS